jgi:hypothetical protein
MCSDKPNPVNISGISISKRADNKGHYRITISMIPPRFGILLRYKTRVTCENETLINVSFSSGVKFIVFLYALYESFASINYVLMVQINCCQAEMFSGTRDSGHI